MRKQTPSQTVGPFYSIGLARKPMNVMATDATQGQRIRIEGQVFDGAGVAIPDVMVEIWQANTYGRYNHPDDKQEKPLDPTFTGWGRSGTDEKCFYTFETVKPGPVPGNDESVQAPHINVVVFTRGMLVHAYTRLYFADEPANASDPVLNSIKNKKRRQTLIASPGMENGKTVYRFDIRLQGDNETVFFDM
jgi:protocatechuate 3,4-dioxygenase, alpha subunit